MKDCYRNSSGKYKPWKINADGNNAINEDGDTLSIRVKIDIFRTRKRDGKDFWEGAFTNYPQAVEHLAYTVECENKYSAEETQ